MNNEIKVCLTIELEGSTLVCKSQPEKIEFVVTERDINPLKKWKGKEGLKVVRKGKISHHSYDVKPAKQRINITMESYKYMISSECPSWMKVKDWLRMSKKARLEAHLAKTCEHFMGKSFVYEVLED